MENKNELSDIVLEKDGDKILKTKRVLIIISILIILFLVVILSMKLFNNPTNTKTPNLILPPEPTSTVKKVQKDEELFKQVPIIEENNTKKDNFENIVKNLKDKESKIDKIEAKKAEKIPETKEKTTIQPVVKPVVKPKTQKQKVEKTVKKTKNLLAKTGIFIQVGATSKHSPDKKFLKKISNKKLSYRLLPISINGKKITKILIGPFDSRKTAKQNLPDIRKSFNKNAFIYTVK